MLCRVGLFCLLVAPSPSLRGTAVQQYSSGIFILFWRDGMGWDGRCSWGAFNVMGVTSPCVFLEKSLRGSSASWRHHHAGRESRRVHVLCYVGLSCGTQAAVSLCCVVLSCTPESQAIHVVLCVLSSYNKQITSTSIVSRDFRACSSAAVLLLYYSSTVAALRYRSVGDADVQVYVSLPNVR